jgi:hypothetical protein
MGSEDGYPPASSGRLGRRADDLAERGVRNLDGPQPVECRQPFIIAGDCLAIDQARPHLSAPTAAAISGYRSDQSCLLRVSSRMPAGSRRTIMRKPSCLRGMAGKAG